MEFSSDPSGCQCGLIGGIRSLEDRQASESRPRPQPVSQVQAGQDDGTVPQAGIDAAEMERWIEEALVYVPSVARRFMGCGIPFDELLAAGNLGLVQAALRYDDTRGIKFITYADWWIRKSVLKTIQEQSGPVRLPRYRQEQLRELHDARSRFRSNHGREPTHDDLALLTGRRTSEIAQLLGIIRRGISIEQPVNPTDELPLGSMLADDPDKGPQNTVIRNDYWRHVRELLSTLDRREREVLVLRYGFDTEPPRTLREVGGKMGISRERVRQIERRALDRLRDLLFQPGTMPPRPATT